MAGTPTTPEPRVRLRPLADGDAERLAAILAEPAVRRWWGDPDPGDPVPPDDGELLVVDVGGEVAGLIQFAESGDPRYRSASIDIALSAAFCGRGIGREAVGVLVRRLIEERGHHRLTIDPALANERAIRCYEAMGFRRVGVLREYERDDDGRWHDGLLMELLAREWRFGARSG